MDTRDKSTMANVVGWLALVLSIAALVLAWTAYNNSSEENLGDMIQEQLQGPVQNEPAGQNDFDGTGGTTGPEGTNGTMDDGTMNDGVNNQQDDAVMPEDGTL